MTKRFLGLFVFVGILSFSGVSAGEIPDCWKIQGVVPGRYLIGGDLNQLSKGEIIELLDRLQGRRFKPLSYITLMNLDEESTFFVPVEARRSEAAQDPTLQAEIKAEIVGIVSNFKSLYAECDWIVHPK